MNPTVFWDPPRIHLDTFRIHSEYTKYTHTSVFQGTRLDTSRIHQNTERSFVSHTHSGPWKSDKYSRGGRVTFNGTKNCPWRRRMKVDGSKFARIVQEGQHMHIQEGMLVAGDSDDADDADQEANDGDIDDENHIGDTGEASSRTGKKASPKKSPKSPKSKAKGKKQKAVEEPTVEEEVPAKRQRRTRAQA